MIINGYMKLKIFCRCSFFSFLVGLRTYQHLCNNKIQFLCKNRECIQNFVTSKY
jgi:hypothetical protein